MNWRELQELQERAARLTPEEQLYLVERLVASVREGQFVDHATRHRDLETMASDPGVQGELDVWRTGPITQTDRQAEELLRSDIQKAIGAADRGDTLDGPTFINDLLARPGKPDGQVL